MSVSRAAQYRTYIDPRSVERVTLTCVTTLRGGGIPGEPVREVRIYYDDEGRQVAEYDPITRDPIVLQKWFKQRGWAIDMGNEGSGDPFKDVVSR